MSQKRRKSRGVVDTTVLVAGVAGMKDSVHESNIASAKSVQRWVEERPFVWLVTEEILAEYREVLARLRVRRPLIERSSTRCAPRANTSGSARLAICLPTRTTLTFVIVLSTETQTLSSL